MIPPILFPAVSLQLLTETGFADVRVEDCTKDLVAVTQQELKFLAQNKAEFIKASLLGRLPALINL